VARVFHFQGARHLLEDPIARLLTYYLVIDYKIATGTNIYHCEHMDCGRVKLC